MHACMCVCMHMASLQRRREAHRERMYEYMHVRVYAHGFASTPTRSSDMHTCTCIPTCTETHMHVHARMHPSHRIRDTVLWAHTMYAICTLVCHVCMPCLYGLIGGVRASCALQVRVLQAHACMHTCAAGEGPAGGLALCHVGRLARHARLIMGA